MRYLRNRRTGEIMPVNEADMAKYNVAPAVAAAAPAPATTNRSLLLSLLPLLGSIGGTTVGGAFGPVGMVAGGGIGGGLGEGLAQLIGGETFNPGKLGTEAAFGAGGGVLGALLGGAGKLAKAGKIGAEAGLGEKIAAKPYTSEALQKLTGRNIASRASSIGKTATQLKGVTAPAKLASIGENRGALNKLLEGITGSEEATNIPIDGKAILNTAKGNMSKTLYKDFSNKILEKQITGVTNAQELGKLNQDLLIRMQGASKEQKAFLGAIQKVIGDTFKGSMKETAPIYAELSKLNAAEPIIQKQAGATSKLFGFETQIPQRLQEGLQTGVGSGMGKVGDIATLGGRVPISVSAGQAIPRIFTGGSTSTQGYSAQPEEAGAMNEYAPEAKQDTGLLSGLTAEKVALARLTLPKKQADAIEAAYTILNKKGATQASEDFINKAKSTIKSINQQQTLGYGPIQGRYYEAAFAVGGGTSVPADIVALNQRYTILKLNVLRAYQGARISDADFRLAQLYIPQLSDTDTVARTKLKVLNELLSTAEAPPTPNSDQLLQ